MIKGKKVLGAVLARANSKGLPGKNSKDLSGKPLIQYTFESALNSLYIDEVVISTDCQKCIKIANQFNVNVPFVRPDNLSGDTVSSAEVIQHLIGYLGKKGYHYDYFVLLEPTSPLRSSKDIDNAIMQMIEEKNKSLVSVCQAEDQHPSFMFEIKENGNLNTWSGEVFKPLRRQDIGRAYYLEGSVYVSEVETFLRLETFCHEETSAYIVPKWKAYEIDDIWDFLAVQAIIDYKKNNPEAFNE